MTTTELIRSLDLRHLGAGDVEKIEEAMSTDDAEIMLTLVDALIWKAKKPVTQKDRRRR